MAEENGSSGSLFDKIFFFFCLLSKIERDRSDQCYGR